MGNNTNKTTVLEKEDLVKLRKELLGEEELNLPRLKSRDSWVRAA